MNTNRDLYLFVTELAGESDLKLENFLEAFRCGLRPFAADPGISLEDFAAAIAGAFEGPVKTVVPDDPNPEWRACDEVLKRQVEDMKAMREAGMLDDPMIFFGIDAPGGSRWYNFDPAGYLECAMAGSLGGWEEGDEGRTKVDGMVTVLGGDGNLTAVHSEDIEEPIEEIDVLTWEDVDYFIWAGQAYE